MMFGEQENKNLGRQSPVGHWWRVKSKSAWTRWQREHLSAKVAANYNVSMVDKIIINRQI